MAVRLQVANVRRHPGQPIYPGNRAVCGLRSADLRVVVLPRNLTNGAGDTPLLLAARAGALETWHCFRQPFAVDEAACSLQSKGYGACDTEWRNKGVCDDSVGVVVLRISSHSGIAQGYLRFRSFLFPLLPEAPPPPS